MDRETDIKMIADLVAVPVRNGPSQNRPASFPGKLLLNRHTMAGQARSGTIRASCAQTPAGPAWFFREHLQSFASGGTA
jgi:hypothetical protein